MILFYYFGVFGSISTKMDEISKIWAMSRVLCRGVGTPRCGVAEKKDLASLGYAAEWQCYAPAKCYAEA